MIIKFKKFTKRYLPFAADIAKKIFGFAKQQESRKKIRRLLRQKKELFVEIGAGDKAGQRGWITIDMTKQCDIFWDLRNGVPFPEGSISKIYSSHLFEHLSYHEAQILLRSCLKALMPGGSFLICVPNARLYLEAYVQNKPLDSAVFFGYEPAFNSTTRIDAVNYIAYMNGEHKYMFDEENLLYLLESGGFEKARLRSFDPQLDLKERDFESIYAAAEKAK
jgi:predicted SAM-dependent methyltransferase